VVSREDIVTPRIYSLVFHCPDQMPDHIDAALTRHRADSRAVFAHLERVAAEVPIMVRKFDVWRWAHECATQPVPFAKYPEHREHPMYQEVGKIAQRAAREWYHWHVWLRACDNPSVDPLEAEPWLGAYEHYIRRLMFAEFCEFRPRATTPTVQETTP
jgi:hypothetical protein